MKSPCNVPGLITLPATCLRPADHCVQTCVGNVGFSFRYFAVPGVSGSHVHAEKRGNKDDERVEAIKKSNLKVHR